jgi:hypothetical protein
MSDKFLDEMFAYIDSPKFTSELMVNLKNLEIS